jgi:myosin heavy subunit
VNTILNRLKQSIASAKDFAVFLKRRGALEEEHATGLKKLCRSTFETIRKQDARHGSYARQLEEVMKVNERMAENGSQFGLSLHQMHEDLTELSNNMERGRKQWKQTGLAAETRVQEAEKHMEKAKAKYDSLASDYDRVKTGDTGGGRKFGIKGPKSTAQQEEDLQRKVQAADADYAAKVQAAQAQRQELMKTSRPQAVKAIQELVTECDSALTLQLQKFGKITSPPKKDFLLIRYSCFQRKVFDRQRHVRQPYESRNQ